MKGRIVVEVPDDWIAERAAEAAREIPDEPPDPDGSAYFRGRLEDVINDELPLALYSWPAEFSLEVET